MGGLCDIIFENYIQYKYTFGVLIVASIWIKDITLLKKNTNI